MSKDKNKSISILTHNKIRMFSGFSIFVIALFSFAMGFVFVQAQVWHNPNNNPPILNAGQPISVDNLDNLVVRGLLDVQEVVGPIIISSEDNSVRAYFGDSLGLGHGIHSFDEDPDDPVSFSYPSAEIGVFGYGTHYGVYGESGASAISDVQAGVAGAFTGDTGLAARFLGPFAVQNRITPAVDASLEVEGLLEVDGGVYCIDSSCDLTAGATNYWLRGQHRNSGTAIYAKSIDNPGIDILIHPNSSGSNAAAVLSASGSFDALAGSGLTGIYGSAGAVDGNGNPIDISDKIFTGVGGFALSSGPTMTGVYGESSGGGVHNKISYSATDPEHDFSSGVRACFKEADGDVINKIGLDATAGEYAGYFDGNLFFGGDSSGIAFRLGNTLVTEHNLRGLYCMANSIPLVSCHNGNYAHRKKIDFNPTGSGVLTDFPVLIKLDNSFPFGDTLNGGTDIAFYEADGATLLKYEIEKWDHGNEAYIWVKLPGISLTLPDHIYMYYGDPGAISKEDAENVWTNGYAGVWHMSEDPSVDTNCGEVSGTYNLCDSTSNNNHAVANGSFVSGDLQPGQVGDGIFFDGDIATHEYFEIPHNASHSITGNITLQAWSKLLLPYAYGGIIAKTDGLNNWNYLISMGDDQGAHQNAFYFTTDGIFGPFFGYCPACTIQDTSWHSVALTRTGNNMMFYGDGTNHVTETLGGNFPSTSIPLRIGTDGPPWYENSIGGGSAEFNGTLDEVRLSNMNRADNWMQNEYSNISNPSAYITITDDY